jgi:hypothetical protein
MCLAQGKFLRPGITREPPDEAFFSMNVRTGSCAAITASALVRDSAHGGLSHQAPAGAGGQYLPWSRVGILRPCDQVQVQVARPQYALPAQNSRAVGRYRPPRGYQFQPSRSSTRSRRGKRHNFHAVTRDLNSGPPTVPLKAPAGTNEPSEGDAGNWVHVISHPKNDSIQLRNLIFRGSTHRRGVPSFPLKAPAIWNLRNALSSDVYAEYATR